MTQLPLHHEHQEKGAHFAPFDDWELPEHYGDPLREYQAIRKEVGLADLSYQGSLLLSGDDRKAFLQKLVSNDLDLLSDNTGIYSCLLTAKGKLISDFHLFALSKGLASEVFLLASEVFLIDVAANNAANTQAQLMRYRMRSKVAISVPDWGRLLLAGPKAKALLASCFDAPLPALAEKSFFQKEMGKIPVLCIKRAITGEEDYHLFVAAGDLKALWDRLLEAGQALNLSLVGQKALEILRIEAGLPRYGIDMDEDILPIEAGLQSETISYTKGCYPGQEVMARIQTYGHVNKQLSGLLLEGDVLPKKGDQLFRGEKIVGAVTSAVKSPRLGKIIAMAYLKTSAASPGTALEVAVKDKRSGATVQTLPFYKKPEN